MDCSPLTYCWSLDHLQDHSGQRKSLVSPENIFLLFCSFPGLVKEAEGHVLGCIVFCSTYFEKLASAIGGAETELSAGSQVLIKMQGQRHAV